jgi:predicted MPP superfamily phosphohydrolase
MKILTCVLFALVVWRMIWPLKNWYLKGALIALAGAGAFKFQVFRIIGGHYFAPDLPEWVIMGGALLYGGFYFVPVLLLVSEAVRAFRRRKDQKFWNRINVGIAVCALLLSSLALVLGALAPRVNNCLIEHPQVPEAADGMKAVFITDLHIDRTTKAEKIRKMVDQVNALQADVILLGGDLMDGPVAQCGNVVKELNGLKAPLGVLGVPGNHEYYSDFEAWYGYFRESSLKLLLNEKTELPNGIVIAGIGDHAGRIFFRKNAALLEKYADFPEKALKGIEKERFVLFLAHRPEGAREHAALGADLQLSGHTHGGMIWGFDKLVGLYNGGWVSGRYQVGEMTLLVSNGTWLWKGFPLRLGRPGEILLVTLKRKK